MRFLFIGVAIVAIIFSVMAITFQIFGAASSGLVLFPGVHIPTSTTPGAKTVQKPSTVTTTTNPQSGFRGPDEGPHLIGPSGPPPNY